MKQWIRTLFLTVVAVFFCCQLAACAPLADSVAVEGALTEAGYTVSFAGDDVISSYMSERIDLDEKLIGTLSMYDTATKQRTEQYIAIYYFADVENAKKAIERVTADASAERSEKYADWVEPTRKGKVIYYGTAAAVEAAKQ